MIRTLSIAALILCASTIPAVAQTAQATVGGYLYNADASPAINATVSAMQVERSGASYVITPILLTTDVTGWTTFSAPQGATLWIAAKTVGLASEGDAGILVPIAPSADLNVLAQTARPPVSGITVSSGANPVMSLTLPDFGVSLSAVPPPATVESLNGRTGAVTLTAGDISAALSFSPLDPTTVVGAVNASTDTIDDGRLSANVVRQNFANIFTKPQTFSTDIAVTGTQSITASTDADLMRFYRYSPAAGWELGSKINSQGAFLTNAWITVSGTGNAFTQPSADAYMVGIWSDVGGPSLQVRTSNAPGSYLFSGLDNFGKYTFGVEGDGRLQWGASTRAAMDTNLYRAAPASLKTDGSLTVGGQMFLGAADTKLFRSAAATLRTNSGMLVDGGLGIGVSTIAYPLAVRGSAAAGWNYAARFEASANVDGGGGIVEVGAPGLLYGARLYGGRWSSADRGARLAGVNQLGQEKAWLQVNGEGSSVAINTGGVDRLTVKSNGNVGINTASPAPDAVLDVNGGDSKGFRITPRSAAGAPATGTWSAGTMIVDSTAVVYICVTAGSPGVWQRLTASVAAAAAAGAFRYDFAPTAGVNNVIWATAETTSDPAAADFNMAIATGANPGSPRNNVTSAWGYNSDGAGVRVVPTEPALNYRIESFYSPTSGTEYMESHLQYQSKNGLIRRPFAVQIERNTDQTTVEVHGDSFSFLGPEPAKTQYVKFAPKEVMLLNSTFLDSYTNNHQWLRQRNKLGTGFINLAYLDDSDRIRLGGGVAASDVIVTGQSLTVGNTSGAKLTNVGGSGVQVSKADGGGAFLMGSQLPSDPSAPGAGGWKLFAKDDGTGKTSLCVQFATGPPQCFARQQ